MPRANRHRRQESRSRRRRARRALNEFMLDDDDDLEADEPESPSWSSGTAAEMGDPPSDDAGFVLAEAPKNR